jgi:hypothetical protein
MLSDIRAKRICAAVVLTVIVIFTTAGFSLSDANAVYAAEGDTLTIRVGYMGTEYVERIVYTDSMLRDMGLREQAYTWIDAGNFPVMQATRGVSLIQVIEGAGIDPGSVQRLYFDAKDGHNADFEYTRQSLFDTERYYYPDLIKNWDKMNNCPGAFTEDTRVSVEPMIAIEQYWERWLAEPAWGKMDTHRGFRLVYGMAGLDASVVGDAHNSVHSLTAINVQLVGSPPKEPGNNDEDDLVGSNPDNEDNGSGDGDGDGKGDGDGDDETPIDEVEEEPIEEEPIDEVEEEPIEEEPVDETEEESEDELIGSGNKGRGKGIGDKEGDGMGSGSPSGNHLGGSLIGSSEGVDRRLGEPVSITLSSGEIVTARALLQEDAIGLVSLASAGGSNVGDNPWTVYEISPESEPLQIPVDNEMVPYVGGALLLCFALGGVGQYIFIKSSAVVRDVVSAAIK